MTSNDPHQLAELVEEVIDAATSGSDDGVDTLSAIVRKHVQLALHAEQTPDIDAVLSAIIEDESDLP